MKVYLCYLTRSRKEKLVKIVDSFEEAKKWQHEFNKITRELVRLKGRYYVHLTTTKHKLTKDHHMRKSKVVNDYYDFIRKHKLDGTETLSSAYFHDWEVTNV